MAVDLTEYITALQTEISAPGNIATDFPAATADDWTNTLLNAFWEARLDGLLATYTMDDNGLISPILAPGASSSSTPDIGRDMIQLIVLYASFAVIRNSLRGLRTMFSATAGPVKYEYQTSALMLVELMKDLIMRRNTIIARLSDLGTSKTYVIDSIAARDDSLISLTTYWVSQGDRYPGSLYGLTG